MVCTVETLDLTVEEIEILIVEQALRNTKEHAARCANRVRNATSDLNDATSAVSRLDASLNRIRSAYLSKASNESMSYGRY